MVWEYLIFNLCSYSSADPIRGNQQGTSISLLSFPGGKNTFQQKLSLDVTKVPWICRQNSTNLSIKLKSLIESKEKITTAGNPAYPGPEPALRQLRMCSPSVVEPLRFPCCRFQLPNIPHTRNEARFQLLAQAVEKLHRVASTGW